MREASANGVHVTPYVYLQNRTVEEAEAAARYAVDVAKNYNVSYPWQWISSPSISWISPPRS